MFRRALPSILSSLSLWRPFQSDPFNPTCPTPCWFSFQQAGYVQHEKAPVAPARGEAATRFELACLAHGFARAEPGQREQADPRSAVDEPSSSSSLSSPSSSTSSVPFPPRPQGLIPARIRWDRRIPGWVGFNPSDRTWRPVEGLLPIRPPVGSRGGKSIRLPPTARTASATFQRSLEPWNCDLIGDLVPHRMSGR